MRRFVIGLVQFSAALLQSPLIYEAIRTSWVICFNVSANYLSSHKFHQYNGDCPAWCLENQLEFLFIIAAHSNRLDTKAFCFCSSDCFVRFVSNMSKLLDADLDHRLPFYKFFAFFWLMAWVLEYYSLGEQKFGRRLAAIPGNCHQPFQVINHLKIPRSHSI